MTSPEPGEMEDVVNRVGEFASSLERSPDRLMVYEGDAIAERLRSLLAHLSRQEEEIKGLRAEVKALATCPQFVAANKIAMLGPNTTYPSRTAANHVRATITRLLTEIERIAGA